MTCEELCYALWRFLVFTPVYLCIGVCFMFAIVFLVDWMRGKK